MRGDIGVFSYDPDFYVSVDLGNGTRLILANIDYKPDEDVPEITGKITYCKNYIPAPKWIADCFKVL